MTNTTTAQPTIAGAYGYVDSHGRIRAISASRSDAIRNARLNGMPNIVHLRTTPSGSVPCTGPSPVIRWEDWRTGETFQPGDRHGVPGQLNVVVLDVDSSVTNYGRHNRCVVVRSVADPSELIIREDLRGLPLTTDDDRRRVANGWQRLHPRGSRLVHESSTSYTTPGFGESIEHIYRIHTC